MSYLVIARKYRPQRFSDVVGQEHVTQTLTNAIRQNRIAHAYLFVGPRGTGKTTAARIFAKCLNCTGGPKVDFPDDDPRCIEIAEGRSMDVQEIDGASNRGIEEIRALRETVRYAPATSKFRIYIIDEVHMLTKEAFNALLKTLEEPPDHVKFMFATTEPEKVLPTILSRCQRFDLRRIPSALIVKHLAHIAKLEKVKIDEPALFAIARGADGGMRDAESTLDQLISFCGNEIVEADVLSMFGLTSRDQILSLAYAMIAGDVQTALRELNDLAKHGKDLARLLSELLNHFRNLLLYRVSSGDLSLLEASETEGVALAEHSSQVEPDALARMMEVLSDCETRLRDAASKKILIEVALLKTIQAKNAVPIDAVLKKLRQLRSETTPIRTPQTEQPSGPPERSSVKAPVKSPGSKPFSIPAQATRSDQMHESVAPHPSTDLADLWSKVVESVGRVSPFARTYLQEAHPVGLSKNAFTIGFDPEFADHASLVDNTKNRTLIQTKLSELGCGDVHVKFVVAPAPSQWVRPNIDQPEAEPQKSAMPPSEEASGTSGSSHKPEASQTSADDFKNDPLIREALEIFKGTIVEVRS
ncbi:MAG: DNA polymerase III subunit gamma/tau [Verrucomicrobia bacterium]|nr:DNA polymerase III subunit gamma/tau [Verrucomicrobiota bacterium]